MSISILTQFNFLLHCIISLILGSAIGIEREYKQKPAGLKTHALICMGSAAITFLSLHIGEITGSAISDPARIAAQIVSGIGFIGAGTILQSRQIVQGLTTAASLWVVAAIGMLAGASMFIAATVLTMIALILLLWTKPLSRLKTENQSHSLTIQINKTNALRLVEELIRKFEIKVDHKLLTREENTSFLEINYYTTPIRHHLFLKRLFVIKGIGKIRKI